MFGECARNAKADIEQQLQRETPFNIGDNILMNDEIPDSEREYITEKQNDILQEVKKMEIIRNKFHRMMTIEKKIRRAILMKTEGLIDDYEYDQVDGELWLNRKEYDEEEDPWSPRRKPVIKRPVNAVIDENTNNTDVGDGGEVNA